MGENLLSEVSGDKYPPQVVMEMHFTTVGNVFVVGSSNRTILGFCHDSLSSLNSINFI